VFIFSFIFHFHFYFYFIFSFLFLISFFIFMFYCMFSFIFCFYFYFLILFSFLFFNFIFYFMFYFTFSFIRCFHFYFYFCFLFLLFSFRSVGEGRVGTVAGSLRLATGVATSGCSACWLRAISFVPKTQCSRRARAHPHAGESSLPTQTRKITFLSDRLSGALAAIFGIYARFCGEWWHREALGQFWGPVSVGHVATSNTL